MPGQDVGFLYVCYNHLAIKGLNLRSSCLSSSTRLKIWNQTQLTDLFSKLKIQRLLVLPIEFPVFGPWGSARMWLDIWSSCYPLPPTGFQDQDCERTAWEAEKGWLEDQASFPKVLGLNFSQRNILCIN